MTTAVGSTPAEATAGTLCAGPYGYFTDNGATYCITNPRTPRPWTNIIANPRMGLAISQTGSGFTWIDNSQLAVITRWKQEFAEDSSGKFLYVRDEMDGRLWSLAPAPAWAEYERYECRHSLGATTFLTQYHGIDAEWTLCVHPEDTVEFWRVRLTNASNRTRRLGLTAYLEWNCGVLPSPRREFHKLFLETSHDAARRAIFARNHMWDVPGRERGHWNTDFPYISAFACSEPLEAVQGDKGAFLGRNGAPRAPLALEHERWRAEFGRHADPIAAMRSVIMLAPGQSVTLGYGLFVDTNPDNLERRIDAWQGSPGAGVEVVSGALEASLQSWRRRLTAHRVQTPEPSLNFLANDWIRYQAISGRLWGRAGYYQQSGAFGFRDQLQDSQVWLTIDPPRCREQINLHAGRQFADGSVYHWWHPLSEQGQVTRMTDDLLWLGFVTANYIRETADLTILADRAPFLDDRQQHTLAEHVWRAFQRVFLRTSARGLPFIGEGDWNDGLSAAGRQERGESIWLGHFLVGLLRDWAEIYRRADAASLSGPPGESAWSDLAEDFEKRRAHLVQAINEHGWDGQWYWRATLDDGDKIGSRENKAGRIFLNAQTWAILNDVAPPARAVQCMAAVREWLIDEVGPLLLAPAYAEPDARVGYITRYAPGLRENGGVYTHAATWAIAAACRSRDADLVGKLLSAINPALKDSERYWAEPYVLPGNVDGPDSPHHGRGGWTWYTGSAQWLHRVLAEWVLGVRAEWDGLRLAPCLPPGWDRANMTRPYRGGLLRIEIERDERIHSPGGVEVTLDGRRLDGALLTPTDEPGVERRVNVRFR